MPQRKLNQFKLVIDATTGFVRNLDPRSKITPSVKLLFLAKLKEMRDIDSACKAAGFSRRVLKSHLLSDAVFNDQYKQLLVDLKDPQFHEKQRSEEVLGRLWLKLTKQPK